ncbi:MAG: uracil-DNA glycosylase, partial [Ardenticatenaceae bacterium]
MDRRSAVEALRAETVKALTPQLTSDQTQVVFGDGDPTSPLMIVGEAPGPQEDREGVPFVGRSGQLLNTTLQEIGLERNQVWISNTVKLLPTTRSGASVNTRAPNAAERKASRSFFEREIELIEPRVIICLGGTAAKALIEKNFKITEERGEWREGPRAIPTLATYHPSYILRVQGFAPDDGSRLQQEFASDLRRAALRAGLV